MDDLFFRKDNTKNEHQGEFKKVLCVCSAGLLRSPTAAWVLSNPPFNFNTRAAGIEGVYALILVDDVLLTWADEVVVMNGDLAMRIREKGYTGLIVDLRIKDSYDYRDPELVNIITERYRMAAKL